ncbi:MAG TPA: PAS domain S-box protein [Patescibacteria group bacterium]|nr:PAS domain S-box protein [Patescibacteria group bacterium]
MTGKQTKAYPVTTEYLASVFEGSPVALISLDTRLRIIMFNRAAQILTGYRSEDVIGRRIGRIVTSKHLREIVAALRGRGEVSIDGYVTKLSGSGHVEIPVRLRISPLYSERDGLLGFIAMAMDMREVETERAKLIEAERLAAINETAISINHEINNPLCAILGNTQLMLMEGDRLDTRMVKKLHSIEKQIARIQGYTKRLSHITRPVVREYIGGKTMIDAGSSEADDSSSEE